MTRFLILLGGELAATPRLRRQIAGARVIAADGGIRHAAALGVAPELWVGDFDSASPADLASHGAVPQLRFPAAKDTTDGGLAVAEALRRGADEIVLAGAFGGPRPDHAFAHLTMALRLAGEGRRMLLSSGREEGWPLVAGAGPAIFDFGDGTLFSVLGFSRLSGLTIGGARWPLDRVTVEFGSSLTVSNAVEEGPLRVSLERGSALLLAYPGADD
jgi:thiamine pyrophosphokinase